MQEHPGRCGRRSGRRGSRLGGRAGIRGGEDNGDGTLTIAVQATGPNTYFASGKRLFTDTGVVRYTVLVDSAGTPGDPSDDGEATFVSFDKFSGVSQTDCRDFCADLQTYLG